MPVTMEQVNFVNLLMIPAAWLFLAGVVVAVMEWK